LNSTDKVYDAHIRTEKVVGKRVITVDVFRSSIKSAARAHVESDLFAASSRGAKEAQGFLKDYGFAVRVRPLHS
jgi:hypothetical protein